MKTLLIQVLAFFKGNFVGLNANISLILDLFGTLSTKVKAAVDSVTQAVATEKTDRENAINQEVNDRQSAIADAKTSVLGQVDTKLVAVNAAIDIIKSGTAKIVKTLVDPTAATQSVAQVLANALAQTAETVQGNRTYLLEFIGNISGEQNVDNAGTVEAMSSGEKYLIHTDASGAIATAEIFTNPIEEITKDFLSDFDALKTGLQEIVTVNDAALLEQGTKIASIQQQLAGF